MMRIFICMLAVLSLNAFAEEIRVLSGGAAKSFVDPVAAAYTAHPVRIEYQPMGKLTQSLAAKSPVDLVIVTSEVFDQLAKDGRLAPGSGTPLARVGVGVAVNEKAPLPDISTAEALKRTLLAAKSVVYIDPKIGTSGKHVAEVLKKLNIEDEVNRKATLGTGGYVVAPVGKGEIELGIHQISEIVPVPGVRLVGPLPAELQKYTVYVAAPVPGAQHAGAARDFVAALTAPAARARLAAAGYTAP